jgi:uncharacterized phosphatase
MTQLLLVRHGRTEWNQLGRLQGREDIPLDDVGTAQAAAAARVLAEERWDAVVSSPLGRALGTAELIASACGLPMPTTDPDLVERHYGLAAGLHDHEVTARWPDWVLPGSESRLEVYDRARPVLSRLAREYPSGRVVVVSHGGVIRSVVMGVEGWPARHRRGMDNLGATLLRTDGDSSDADGNTADAGWTVAYYNRLLA